MESGSQDGARSVRVVACCGGMVLVSGMERMTFEVLRALRRQGAEVHCILNRWENHRIRALAESVGASWSTGYYWHRFDRHTRNPMKLARFAWDILMTSLGLLRDARRFRATHVLLPEHVSVLRNAPALLLLRARGIPVILRLAVAPERGRFYELLWRWVLPPLVSRMVANSEFSLRRCREIGVPESKLALIRNCVSEREAVDGVDRSVVELAKSRPTLLCVGQIAPFKGTHIAVEASLGLLENGADLQLLVLGPEPSWPPDVEAYYRRLVEKVRSSGFGDRVHFAGARNDVLEIMGVSFLLLAPILQEETFGNVVLEAMSVGLPVVTFSRGGLPELVEHEKSGYVCDTANHEGLVAGVQFFLDHPDAWREARERSLRVFEGPRSPFSPATFSHSWRELLIGTS